MPITYEQAETLVFATGEHADGYPDKWTPARYALADGKILVLCSAGYFNAGLPDCIDVPEALWILQNHPSSRAQNVAPIE